MKIEFLTQDDPLYILPFFEEFLRHSAGEFEIGQISCSRTMGKRSRRQLLRELMWLYGSIGVLRLLVRLALSKVRALRPQQRSADRFGSLRQLARAYQTPFVEIGNPNDEFFVAGLRERAPDVLISVACPYILKAPVLTAASLGSINIHHAPLPRYKGMMPTFWQMYHGEKNVGLTIHYMVAKVDEGDALLQEQLEIMPGETLDHLIRRSKRQGALCMIKVLRALQNGRAVPIKLNHSAGTYFTFPKREEALEFRARGLRAI